MKLVNSFHIPPCYAGIGNWTLNPGGVGSIPTGGANTQNYQERTVLIGVLLCSYGPLAKLVDAPGLGPGALRRACEFEPRGGYTTHWKVLKVHLVT